MRIAVISDIHSNLEALQEVLSDIEQNRIDAVVCLGDCIGYGPDPEAVVQQLRSLAIPTVMGNHELGIARPAFQTWFNEPARKSLLRNSELLSDTCRDWLVSLKASLELHGALFVHGRPPDSITEYLFEVDNKRLASIFGKMGQQVCFVGHTHDLELVSWKDGRVMHSGLSGTVQLEPPVRCIVNVGSVGQPRDGTPDAKYVIWDTLEQTLEVRSIPYPAEKTARKIIQMGLPRMHADRLL